MSEVLSAITAINLIAFFMYATDKNAAIKGKRRVSEKTLLAAAALGGWLGAILAMRLFHHKTRKLLFRYGIPAIAILEILVYLVVL